MTVLPIHEELYKRKYSSDQRKNMAEKGHALPDGSFPIPDKEALKDAIQAFGRASNKEQAKKHIKKRAKELKSTDLLPDSWQSKTEKAETFSKPGTADVTPSDLKNLRPLLEHYRKKAHPFTSCKRDQMKHGLSEGHANRRCAVIKDLIVGNTNWRGKGKVTKSDGTWTPEAVDLIDRIADDKGLDDQGNEARVATGALAQAFNSNV